MVEIKKQNKHLETKKNKEEHKEWKGSSKEEEMDGEDKW